MTVARLRLALMGGTAGSPREPPSLTLFVPKVPSGAAPARSVAAAKIPASREAGQ